MSQKSKTHSSQEIADLVEKIRTDFPFVSKIYVNEGQGTVIKEWLETTVGKFDYDWTYLNHFEIRFKEHHHLLLYQLTWHSSTTIES